MTLHFSDGSAEPPLVHWCRTVALPFWAEAGADPRGGVFEALDLTGAPLVSMPKRFRVQMRQAHVFAEAFSKGWLKQGRAASDHAWNFAISSADIDRSLRGTGPFTGFAHILTCTGDVLDPRRDTYDHAFVLLACASRIAALGDEDARFVADRVLGFLDQLRPENGLGYLEGAPHCAPRRQNPHMHLLEAYMAMYDATGEDRWLHRASECASLFRKFSVDGILREHFDADLNVDRQCGHEVELGHIAEWIWLLFKLQAHSKSSYTAEITELAAALVEFDALNARSFLPDLVSSRKAVIKSTMRLWPQTEKIRALSALGYMKGWTSSPADDFANEVYRHRLGKPFPEGWVDQADLHGKVTSSDVPASTLYHIFGAAKILGTSSHAH